MSRPGEMPSLSSSLGKRQHPGRRGNATYDDFDGASVSSSLLRNGGLSGWRLSDCVKRAGVKTTNPLAIVFVALGPTTHLTGLSRIDQQDLESAAFWNWVFAQKRVAGR
jgi:hypothetical protein